MTKRDLFRLLLLLLLGFWMGGDPNPVFAEEGASVTLQREPASPGSGEPRYSMEFRDADIRDVLRALGQEGGMNIILGEEVTGKLTLSFREVPLKEALFSILKIHRLTAVSEGGILRVIKSPSAEGEEDLQTAMIPVNYATAKEIADAVAHLLGSKGKISVDVRNNTLILRDAPEHVERIKGLVARMDSETRQVMIEARIVEATTSFARQLGVQWGGTFTDRGSRGIFQVAGGGTKDPATGTITPLTGGTGLSGSSLAVNLPAEVGEGTGGAIGLSFGNVSNTAVLDLQLSAMEDSGKGKILSNPRIMTLNNKEATISSGTQVLIPTILTTGATPTPSVEGGTTGVTEKEATLKLTVTPHVTFDDKILLKIKTKREEFDFNKEVFGIPPKTIKEAETDLMVRDGETVAIGGIYTENTSKGDAGVPFLSKIPILGWLFKKESQREDKSELIIFITPTIQKGAS